MQFDENVCDIQHSFNCHGSSRGPSAIAELLVDPVSGNEEQRSSENAARCHFKTTRIGQLLPITKQKKNERKFTTKAGLHRLRNVGKNLFGSYDCSCTLSSSIQARLWRFPQQLPFRPVMNQLQRTYSQNGISKAAADENLSAEVGRNQIHLVSRIIKVGGDASHGSYKVVPPMWFRYSQMQGLLRVRCTRHYLHQAGNVSQSYP